LELHVERTLRGGVHEDIDIVNYGIRTATFPLVIEAACDFADLFEVRGLRMRRDRLAQRSIRQRNGRRELQWLYEREDFRRGLILRIPRSDSPPRFAEDQVTFNITIKHGERWHACVHLVPVVGAGSIDAPESCHATLVDELEDQRQRWYRSISGCNTLNEHVRNAFRQAVDDITVLRLTAADSSVEQAVVAAGLPWFATLFGRDSLIISLQTLPFTKHFAPAVLRALGALQARKIDDWRDAQPGKIPHEIRYGELAHFNEIPHTPYYGTADATPLYLIALHETYQWTGDRSLVEELLPVAERALEWIDHYGDLDGDGFQEYLRRSPRGISHQGWKDSGLAVVHGDGKKVESPVALVELQGYVYDAKRRMAALYDLLGFPEKAARLREEALQLRIRFAERFWWPEEQTYYFGLDGRKQPIKSVVSNAGHALWSGIALPEHASAVVSRLMAPDMFSGWGVRTLSSRHPSFNPFSYQLGAVWPHDNSIVALGFRRYRFVDDAVRLAEGMLQAASFFQSNQLPELFAGLPRAARSFPVQYIDANVPQGWAAGSVFTFLQTVVGLRADAAHNQILIDPLLPSWLPRFQLTRLTLGPAKFDLEFFRETPGGRPRVGINMHEGNLDVIERPWSPDEI